MKSILTLLQLVGIAALLAACDNNPDVTFDHGIASGGPLADAVIIWTRVTPVPEEGDEVPETISVDWEVGTDEANDDIVAEGTFETGPGRDYTVKVDVGGLEAGKTYFYRFEAGGVESPVGRTRTLPTGAVDQVRLAVVSCSNFPFGFFNVYRAIADRDDLDAVVHLGDYYYEYGPGGYGAEASKKTGRGFEPDREIVTLEDYRTRHAQYRRDPDLQAMTAKHPLITVWDDHETANNSHKEGAQNHDHDEGEWAVRRNAAVQAYHEWLPTRLPDPKNPLKTYRTIQYGDLASLIMLDTRLYGRDKQFDYQDPDNIPLLSFPFDFSNPLKPVPVPDGEAAAKLDPADIKMVPTPFDVTGNEPQPILDYPRIVQMDPENMPDGIAFIPDAEKFMNDVLGDDSRSMLGIEQEDWLRDELEKSKDAGVPWQVLGQQLLVGRLPMPDLSAQLKPDPEAFWTERRVKIVNMVARLGLPMNLDAWDGYAAARDRLAHDILLHANNAVVLAGDTHNGWAFNLDTAPGDPPYAVEMGTPAVTSDGMEAYLPVDPDFSKKQVMAASRELVYLNNRDRGYMTLTLTPTTATGAWYYVDNILSRDFTVRCEEALQTAATEGPGVVPLQQVPCE